MNIETIYRVRIDYRLNAPSHDPRHDAFIASVERTAFDFDYKFEDIRVESFSGNACCESYIKIEAYDRDSLLKCIAKLRAHINRWKGSEIIE